MCYFDKLLFLVFLSFFIYLLHPRLCFSPICFLPHFRLTQKRPATAINPKAIVTEFVSPVSCLFFVSSLLLGFLSLTPNQILHLHFFFFFAQKGLKEDAMSIHSSGSYRVCNSLMNPMVCLFTACKACLVVFNLLNTQLIIVLFMLTITSSQTNRWWNPFVEFIKKHLNTAKFKHSKI